MKALTIGYSRDVVVTRSLSAAAGANATAYSVPAAIGGFYGRSPHALYVFIRVRG